MHTREDALAFADTLAQHCVGVLRDALLAAVVHGSLTFGDYAPGRSDVDVLIVSDAPLADALVAELVEALEPLERNAPGAADLRVVTRGVAAEAAPAPVLELGLELGRPRDILAARRTPEDDLLVELAICRAHGRSLVGPPPAKLIAPVPDAWVLAVGDRLLRGCEAETPAQRAAYADLSAFTACRVWRFAVEGRHCGKTDAAAWVLARAPQLDAARAALDRRRSSRAEPIDDAALLTLLAVARERVAVSDRAGDSVARIPLE